MIATSKNSFLYFGNKKTRESPNDNAVALCPDGKDQDCPNLKYSKPYRLSENNTFGLGLAKIILIIFTNIPEIATLSQTKIALAA